MARPLRPRRGTTEDSATLLATLTALLTAEKTLAAPIAWVDDDGDLRFTASLDIDGVTEPRLTLFGRATTALPDRKVTLGLRWQDETGRGGNFERLEWRPIKAHINRANAPPDLRLRVIEGSHHHPLALNAALDIGLIQAIQENLPVAEPLTPQPQDWPALLRVAAALWRISELVHVPIPPWQYGLLPLTTDPPQGGRP